MPARARPRGATSDDPKEIDAAQHSHSFPRTQPVERHDPIPTNKAFLTPARPRPREQDLRRLQAHFRRPPVRRVGL
jgi:hypothetical protein